MDIETAIEKCLDELSLSQNTVDAYKQGLIKFQEYLGVALQGPVETLSINHFIRFYPWVAKRFGKSTTIVYTASVQSFFKWLVINEYIDPSYRDTLRLHMAREVITKKREDKMVREPNRDDVPKMLAAARASKETRPRYERNIALVEFLASTGCRINEAMQLKVKDLDMEDRSTRVMGKGSKERKVRFSEAAADALKIYWQARGFLDGPVFARHDRGNSDRISSMTTEGARCIVREIATQAGIDPHKFTPHYFRHAFAIKMLSKTGNLAMVQDALGHKNPKSTRVYAKIYDEDLAAAHRQIFG